MRYLVSGLALAALATAGAAQQARIKETIISDPASAGWNFDGNPRVKQVKADGLPGGQALLVTIGAKGANPWDVQARMKVKDGVAAGDTVTFGFYARADKPDPGKETASVTVRVQRAAAPYDATVEGALEIGREWTFHCLTGVARSALTAAETEVSVQLAGDRHAVAFGPWMATKLPAGAGASAKTGLPCGKAPGTT
jgi:hypothetical protein